MGNRTRDELVERVFQGRRGCKLLLRQVQCNLQLFNGYQGGLRQRVVVLTSEDSVEFIVTQADGDLIGGRKAPLDQCLQMFPR